MRYCFWTPRLRRWYDHWCWQLTGTPDRLRRTSLWFRLLVIGMILIPQVTFAQGTTVVLPDLSFIGDLATDLRGYAVPFGTLIAIFTILIDWSNNPGNFSWGRAIFIIIGVAIIVALIWNTETMINTMVPDAAGGTDDPEPPNPGTP